MNAKIKTFFLTSIIIASLSACQSLPKSSNNYADYDKLPLNEAEFLKRTTDIQKAAAGLEPQRTIYFDKD
ncbi:hypothetical protein [Neisseria wadsworthii]|uniref:hypothetical protein n=1 Tax=Neisseria wadsworthii TaxID=607711 RepID=UPI000D31CFE4|nr:hypothetical protein [Neisseria wadsworthii]